MGSRIGGLYARLGMGDDRADGSYEGRECKSLLASKESMGTEDRGRIKLGEREPAVGAMLETNSR